MTIASEIFPHRRWSPYRLPFRLGLLLFFLSLFTHLSGIFLASLAPKISMSDRPHEFDQIEVDLKNPPAVDTLQDTAKEKPKDAQFQSSRNLEAKEDTSPDRAPTSVAQAPGRPHERTRGAKKSVNAEKIMSFSQADLLKSGEIQRETLRGDNSQVFSPGFLERLKRGEELKVRAAESDYGQFVTRMQRKIAQRWNPRRTFNARMFNYDQIRTEVAIILNEKGELVEFTILQPSPFPDFDEEVKRAVQEASPFPNPHKSLLQEDHLIYMPWRFTVFMKQSGAVYVD
jgi:TonB family protein